MLRLPSRAGWNWKTRICIATFLVVAWADVPARAGTLLDFSIGEGGVVNYTFRRNPGIRGARIKVSELTYGSNVMPLRTGRLSFHGGSLIQSSGDSWLWGSGGGLSLHGCADLNHDAKCDKGDFRGTLLTGNFVDIEVVERNGMEVLDAQISDQLDPQLAALLHLPSTTYTGKLELILANWGRNPGWWVRDKVQGGFLDNFQTVPEPSSIVLLGASLIGLGAFSVKYYFRH